MAWLYPPQQVALTLFLEYLSLPLSSAPSMQSNPLSGWPGCLGSFNVFSAWQRRRRQLHLLDKQRWCYSFRFIGLNTPGNPSIICGKKQILGGHVFYWPKCWEHAVTTQLYFVPCHAFLLTFMALRLRRKMLIRLIQFYIMVFLWFLFLYSLFVSFLSLQCGRDKERVLYYPFWKRPFL